METVEHRVLEGNPQAFKKWAESHIRPIELFAIQYGASRSEAAAVTEMILGSYYKNLGRLTAEQLEEEALYKIMLEELTSMELSDSAEDFFPFEEDTMLLRRITRMQGTIRIPFILHQFHCKPLAEIAAISGQAESNAEQAIHKARILLDGPDSTKKLEFLKASFQRLATTAKIEANCKEELSDPPASSKQKKPLLTKKPILLWSVGGTMLLALLLISIIRSDAYQQSTGEKFITNMEASFQQELDDLFDLIGLQEPEDSRKSYTITGQGQTRHITEETYGYETKVKFKKLISGLEHQLMEEGRINRKEARQKYDALVHELRVPSEMVEQLQKEPLVTDRDRSMAFLEELNKKNTFLFNAYLQILGSNYEKVLASEFYEDGVVNIDRMLVRKSTLPNDLRKALDGMATQYYSLHSVKDMAPIMINYSTPELEKILRENLHPEMDVYIYVLSGVSDVVYTGTFDEQVEVLRKLEKGLSLTKEGDSLLTSFSSVYNQLFYNIAGFNVEQGIFDGSGKVKQEVLNRWEILADSEEESPSSRLFRQLIDENDKSGISSGSELIEYRIWGMLELEIRKWRSEKRDN